MKKLIYTLILWFAALPMHDALAKEPWYVLFYHENVTRNDNGFNAAAYRGAVKAKTDHGIVFVERQVPNGADAEDELQDVLGDEPAGVIAIGFPNVKTVLEVADLYPEVKFTVIDGIVPPIFTNVQSVVFKDHEGAFLAGLVAAMTTQTKQVGFVGGMDVPLIRNFEHGYRQGVAFGNKNVKVSSAMVGDNNDAWSNPERAKELALTQMDKGVDVIFAAAGASGLGALEAVADKGKFGIGVDQNQNALYPNVILTSILKRVDHVVYESLLAMHEKRWDAGIRYLGVKEGALDYVVDEHNEDVLTNRVIERLEMSKMLMEQGLLKVDMYSPY